MSNLPSSPCRCLLGETDEAQTLEQIHSALERMKPSEKVSQQLYSERLTYCRECEHLLSGTCMKCGCYVEMRAALTKGRCPLVGTKSKW